MKANHVQLWGKVQESMSLAGFDFTVTAYQQDLQIPFHSHDFAYFCIVLDGAYTENNRRTAHLCELSTVVFHPIGECHSDFFHLPARCLNVRIDTRFLSYLDNSSDLQNRRYVHRNIAINRLTTRLYKELNEIDEFSALTIEGLMLEITAEFLRDSAGKSDQSIPDWLMSARGYVSEEFTNNLTISSVAAIVGVHPTHLAKEFQRFFQMTVGDFIRRNRVDYACRKIVNSSVPLSEISLEAGFYDQSHFSRIFRRATGMTPGAYRSVYRKG